MPDVQSDRVRFSQTTLKPQCRRTPDSIVERHVPVARASFSYFLKRNYLEGRGTLEMARLLGRQEKLQDERDCLHRTLPSSIAVGIRAALRDCKMSSSGWQSVK
jgi:hypothetical protein